MNIAIRYYSKFGHSKKMADVVAQVAGVNAETVSVPLEGETDMLFLGAGVFLGKVDKSVLAFIDSLNPSQVKCVVLFGSSAIVESPVPQMRKRLEQRGVTVSERSFSCKGSMGPVHAGHPDEKDLSELKAFAMACTAL